jgi:hypothetical protein
VRTIDSAPASPGIHAVRDAIAAGCLETRATVPRVARGVDAGPPIGRSWPFPISPVIEDRRSLPADDVMRAYLFAHEPWMMRTGSGPLLAAALHVIGNGLGDLDALGSDGSAGDSWWLMRAGGIAQVMTYATDVPASSVDTGTHSVAASCEVFPRTVN